MLTVDQQVYFMREAIREAYNAQVMGEVPIGAVVVHEGKIVGRGHNMREKFQDVTFHAEILAITEACHAMHSWRLENCQLFVTLEPCMMCSGAIVNSRIDTVYYAADDPKAGTVHSLYHLLNDDRLNHQVKVESGLLADQCSQMLKTFFKSIRKKRRIQKRLSAHD
ncbi:tRNA adenosine(34) deaminase TadA [Paucilactobacillus suebicus]|uniref:tRNA-specific adenosine deaminase n=1 Tax=Paucilactobacillus suebicus DSM 5007 = KCTC 3549 TaxID=1423807 RepID=A0A0R1W4E6_9LACO|nr:tRNA adenosine(34) deaminase TadA [Paucilactobacillus suebicus]KRM11003.1 tRNA-specific adenosine deaminase [Paucilactobacillus suebicus DSM 5007 = KCTC 3549]